MNGNFRSETSTTIWLDFGNYIFEKGYKKFKGLLFDLNGQELSRETNKIFGKDSSIAIFVLNISQIRSNMNKDSIEIKSEI